MRRNRPLEPSTRTAQGSPRLMSRNGWAPFVQHAAMLGGVPAGIDPGVGHGVWERLHMGCQPVPYHSENPDSIAAAAAAAANAAVLGRLPEPPRSRENLADRLDRLNRTFEGSWHRPLTGHDAALLGTIDEESALMICAQLEARGHELEIPSSWIQARVASVELALLSKDGPHADAGYPDEHGLSDASRLSRSAASSLGARCEGGSISSMCGRGGCHGCAGASGYGLAVGNINAATSECSCGYGSALSALNAAAYCCNCGGTPSAAAPGYGGDAYPFLGAGGADGQRSGMSVDSRVHRQCAWLDSNVFWPGAIDDEALVALSTLPWPKALEICNLVRMKGPGSIPDPSGYLKAAVRREYGWYGGVGEGWQSVQQPVGADAVGSAVTAAVSKRCHWLNENVFGPGAIDLPAMQALSRLQVGRAMEITRILEDVSAGVEKPSSFLIAEAHKEMALGCPGFCDDAATARDVWDDWGNAQVFAAGQGVCGTALGPNGVGTSGGGGCVGDAWSYAGAFDSADSASGHAGGCGSCGCGCDACAGGYPVDVTNENGLVDSAIRLQCLWLNDNIFWSGAITTAAIVALSSIPYARAMELCKDLEEKASKVQNPSGYIYAAVQNEVPADASTDPRIHRRCMWLNKRVFRENAISRSAIAALSTLGVERAMAITKELENKGTKVSNPSGYLRAAVRKEWTADGSQDANRRPIPAQPVNLLETATPDLRLLRRCTWLNAHVFWPGAIDTEAIQALSALDPQRAMCMLRQLEGTQSQVLNPSGVLLAACKNECQAEDGYVDSQIHRRCTWLNANVFWPGAIDASAVQALSCLELGRAMEMCKNLEAKGPHHISDPSRYLKSAVRREIEL